MGHRHHSHGVLHVNPHSFLESLAAYKALHGASICGTELECPHIVFGLFPDEHRLESLLGGMPGDYIYVLQVE